MKSAAGAALLLILGTGSAAAGSPRTAAAQFLSLGAGARALGMGEAYGPVAEGAEAVYWNPAGLAQLTGGDLAYSHVEMLRYLHHDFLAYARPLEALGGAVGAAATLFYQDSLSQVTNKGQTIGTFQPRSEAFALSYARSFWGGARGGGAGGYGAAGGESYLRPEERYIASAPSRGRDEGELEAPEPMPRPDEGYIRSTERQGSGEGALSAGVSVKFVGETLGDRSASAVAADGGVLFRPDALPDLSLSAAFRNFGSRERFISDRESLPAEGDAGCAYVVAFPNGGRLVAAAETAVPLYGTTYVKLGTEYSEEFGGAVRGAIRVGYKSLSASGVDALSGLTAGVGAGLRRFSVDFGFEPMGSLGEVYRLGFNVRF